MNKKIFATTRSFQMGATFATFDEARFKKGVVAPIRKLLDTAPASFDGISVVSCAELGSKFAEEIVNNETPTVHHIYKAFPTEIREGTLVPVMCKKWGLNAGSPLAINEGIEIARSRSASQVLVWSPEIDLNGHMVSEMDAHMEQYDLRLVGYMRNRWYLKLQWAFAQNTCALWDLDLLNAVNGMNPETAGDGKTTVSTIEFGEVPLAGMEDVEAYFRACALYGKFLRWGAVGMKHPAYWDTARKVHGTPEYDNNAKKVARQGLVMDEYAKRIFPHLTPVEVYDEMMRVASFA